MFPSLKYRAVVLRRLLVLYVLLLGGCLPMMKASEETIQGIRRVLVVPVISHNLDVVGMTPADKWRSYVDESLARAAPWQPTTSFAQTIAERLRFRGKEVILALPVPPSKRDKDVFGEDWAWYREAPSALRLRPSDLDSVDVVIEVGMTSLRYVSRPCPAWQPGFTSSCLMARFGAKLVDPKTRRVHAIALGFANVPAKDLQELMDNDAKSFREFLSTGSAFPAAKLLADLGF